MVSAFRGRASAKAISKDASKRSLTRQQELPAHSITLAHLHEEYLRARRAEGIRESTLRMYGDALRLWERWCAGEGVEDARQISARHAQDYLLSLLKRHLSERTIRNRAIVLKGALKYAFQERHIASERLYDWKLPKMARAQVYMPDLSEVGVILAAIPDHWSAALNPRSRFRNPAARTFSAGATVPSWPCRFPPACASPKR